VQASPRRGSHPHIRKSNKELPESPTVSGEAGELHHVGTESVFAGAGFTEVSHPTLRRVVMRIDF
jgi:hypothetical protein